ncbi:expressed unknown protein [Seminavis robusta]|uniref:Uncharacterized protein n=1 Tax=Seminavis robusta TaxID=568900 RepID=A0A9N8EQ21_9STRA|nr:expressed unknown protein [Seminavis robusta]|eukprot:Sro1379_g267660.1 n/a (285) ;mRNA; f:806-1660
MNPVIGDKALFALGGVRPDTMAEIDKIRCHVSYALGQLQAKTTQDQDARKKLLATLEAYIARGEFPLNENDAAPNQRHPCFVDSAGTPCAVAHLMQQSGAKALADTIASSHKYDSIARMVEDEELSPQINSWAFSNGLSVRDLSLIQPTYEFVAREARELFSKVESKLLEASSSATCLEEVERNKVSNLMVRFGDTMISGFGWPGRDIPDYLERIKKLEISVPDDKAEVHELIKLLRQEVEGAKRGNGNKRTTAADYEGFLCPEDLEIMKESRISNRRVRHKES